MGINNYWAWASKFSGCHQMHCTMWKTMEQSCHQISFLCHSRGNGGSPCPVLTSRPVTASAPLCVPKPYRCALWPKLGKYCSEYASSPKKPVIRLMNNRSNRSCRTIGLQISKNMPSWYTVKSKTEKPQLNFQEKNCSSLHLVLIFPYVINMLKVTVLQLVTEKNIQN